MSIRIVGDHDFCPRMCLVLEPGNYVAPNTPNLPTGWSVASTTPTGWDSDSITPITDGTNVVPLPKGFNVSSVDGEYSYNNGVVIKDSSENEFVWVPYTGEYVEEELAYSQDRQDFQDMINTYNGFWIGRYNTTYDSFDESTETYSGVGTKKNGTVLTGLYRV